MKQALEKLKAEAGLSGCMVITPDGIMVAACLGPELEEDRVAAFVSSLIIAVRRGLTQVKAQGPFVSCSLHAERGKVILHDMGNSFLVMMAGADLDTRSWAEPVRKAIHQIQNRRVA